MDRFRAEAEKGTKVYIGNIPPDTESNDLREFFRGYGTINDAWVARKPPGFGFVFFDSEKDARDAVWDLNGRDLRGNRVRVEISKPSLLRGGSPRRGPARDSSRDDRSPPRRGSNGGRRTPSPRSPRGGGRSPRARSPFKEREKDSSDRRDREDDRRRSKSRSRGRREEDRDRRRSRSRSRDADRSRRERSRS